MDVVEGDNGILIIYIVHELFEGTRKAPIHAVSGPMECVHVLVVLYMIEPGKNIPCVSTEVSAGDQMEALEPDWNPYRIKC